MAGAESTMATSPMISPIMTKCYDGAVAEHNGYWAGVLVSAQVETLCCCGVGDVDVGSAICYGQFLFSWLEALRDLALG